VLDGLEGAGARRAASDPRQNHIVGERWRAPRHVERGIGVAGAHRGSEQGGVGPPLGAVVDAGGLESGGNAVAECSIPAKHRVDHVRRVQGVVALAPGHYRQGQEQRGGYVMQSHGSAPGLESIGKGRPEQMGIELVEPVVRCAGWRAAAFAIGLIDVLVSQVEMEILGERGAEPGGKLRT